jgi:flagellar basal-body rod protein FlgC
MPMFDTMRIASSSMGMHQAWIDVTGHNIANVNTATSTDGEAFRAQFLMARSRDNGGVQISGMAQSSAEGRVVYDPENALADAEGNVRMPDIDMAVQMGHLMMAQRGYQAAVSLTKTAQDQYSSAISIGSR